MRLSYFAIALILTAMGCSSVLGLDEFHEASESNAGASGSGGSGATTSDAAGGSSNAAGAAGGTAGTGSGATAGASGSGGTANSWPNEVKCAQGYKPWLQANFDRIDGAALGPTDLPGAPLERSGAAITTSAGRAQTAGEASIQTSQGGTFTTPDLRIRYAVNLSEGRVRVMANAPNGFEVQLNSSGSLKVTSEGIIVAETTFANLDPGFYYVEARLNATAVEAAVAKLHFPSDPGSDIIGALTASPPDGLGKGETATISMTATQGQVAIDNVFIERCGVSPPQVDVLLGDNFDDGVNALDVPSSSSWSATDVASASGRARAHDPATMTTNEIVGLAPYHRIRFVSRYRGSSAYANLRVGGVGYYWSAIAGEEFLPTSGTVFGESGTPPNLPDQDHFVTISVGPNGLALVVTLGGFDGGTAYLKDLPPQPGGGAGAVEWGGGSYQQANYYTEIDDLEVSTYSF